MVYETKIGYKTDWQCYASLLDILALGKVFGVIDRRERQILACVYTGMKVDDICQTLSIKKNHCNTRLTLLRKKGFIDGSNKVKYKLSRPDSVVFKFYKDEGAHGVSDAERIS